MRKVLIIIAVHRGEPVPDTIQFVPDVILASDCVYLEVAFQPLLDSLAAISNKDTDIYMSYKKRRKADKRFFQMARKLFHLTEACQKISSHCPN